MPEFLKAEYTGLKELYFLALESGVVGYRTAAMTSVPERLVRCVWFDQLLNRKRMRTADGRKIEVYSPGEWNCGPGPDFAGSLFRLEGDDSARGDVEIHVRASDWRRHGHHADHRYCDVALHVAMWNDTGGDFITNARGENVPQLILADCIDGDLPSLALRIDMENYPYNTETRSGVCSVGVRSDPERAARLVELAGRERFFGKTAKFQRQLQKLSYDEIIFNGLMEGLGYRHNKKQFRRLAGIVPQSVAAKVAKTAEGGAVDALQAVYFGASGLLSSTGAQLWDEEAGEYFSAMSKLWEEYRWNVGSDRMNKADWVLTGMRPANFPHRRVAGLGVLMSRFAAHGFFAPALEFARKLKAANGMRELRRAAAEFSKSLVCDGSGYWANHLTPGGKRVDKVPALIGGSLADSLVLNIFLPALLCHACETEDTCLRDRLMELYGAYPSLDVHSITRIMVHRLWGGASEGESAVALEVMQQGLLQVFYDFCDGNVRDCSKCAFPGMIEFTGPSTA